MIPAKIDAKIDRNGPGGCWLWTGPLRVQGGEGLSGGAGPRPCAEVKR